MGLWTSTKAAGRLLATEPDRENSADSRLLQGEPFLRPSLRHHEEGGARRHAGRACKKAINDGMQVDIDRAVAIEEGLFGSCFETADQKEGMGAFLEKRKHEPYQNK